MQAPPGIFPFLLLRPGQRFSVGELGCIFRAYTGGSRSNCSEASGEYWRSGARSPLDAEATACANERFAARLLFASVLLYASNCGCGKTG